MTMRHIRPVITLIAFLYLLLSGCSGGKKKPSPAQAYQPDFRQGMSVYNAHCGECHNTGRRDAPTLDAPEEWDFHALAMPGIVQEHAAKGFLGMPRPNGVGRLSNENIADVLHYMARRITDAEEKY